MIMSLTSMYSGKPMRRQFDTSIRSTTAECSPEEPRAWQFRSRHILSIAAKPIAAINFGTRMCTDPRMPVPMFDGQHVIMPKMGCDMNAVSSPVTFFTPSVIRLAPSASRENTPFTSPPISIEMMRRWSPSLTQFTNVFCLLWKMPRPCGQCSW